MKKTLGSFLLVLLLANISHAQEKVGAGMTFLLTPPSARAWGMGGTGAAMLDPFVAYFNPGGLGVYALTSPIGAARNSQRWGPSIIDATHSNTLILASLAIPERTKLNLPVSLGVGLTYHRQVLELAPLASIGYSGDTLFFQELDRSSNFTMSIAVEHGLEAGAGLTLKSVKTVSSSWSSGSSADRTTGTATGRDFGIYARVPVIRALSRLRFTREPIRLGRFKPEIAFTLSYSWANHSRGIKYEDEGPQAALPRVNRLGRSVELWMDYENAPVARFLAARDDEERSPGIEDRHSEGWEADLLGIFQVRGGRFWYASDSRKTSTEGLSVHLNGVVRWAALLARGSQSEPLPWYIENWDIYYHRAKITGDFPLGGTKLNEFGITLNTEQF